MNTRTENFIDIVNSRQSCRDFNDKELTEETVREILKIALKSPSASNSQPWKVYVAMGEKVKDLLESLQENGMNKFVDNAKALVVLAESDPMLKERVEKKYGRDHFKQYDIGELTAYITLTAESMGVKSCILGWVNAEKLKKAVNMKENETCNIVIALGYSDIEVREKKRKEFDDIVTFL